MDFASIHLRLRNPVLQLQLYRHGFFGPLPCCNVPNSAFKRNHGLLLFLFYLTTALDLLLFLSYPSFHILSSLSSYCVSQTPVLRFFILLTTSYLAPTSYSSFFFLSALASTLLSMFMTSLFQAPTTSSFLTLPAYISNFPIPCTISLNPARISCTIYISKSQHSPILFPLSPETISLFSILCSPCTCLSLS